MKTLTLLFLLTCAAAAQSPGAPPLTKEEAKAAVRNLLQQNSFPITIDQTGIAGAGADKIIESGRRSQFVVIAEQHYSTSLPRLTTALLRALQPAGYEYVADETATAQARWVSEAPLRGNKQAIFSFVHRYPYSLTFYSDAEAQMLAEVGAISRGKGRPVWGIDQEFGAEPALERIAAAAPNAVAKDFAQSLLKRAHDAESDRAALDDSHHFIANGITPDELHRLQQLYQPSTNADVKWLIQDLIDSNYIYDLYLHPTTVTNSYVRELYLRRIFLEEYRRAEKLDGKPPKVIFKAGHWHALRGMNPARQFTTGNMLSELAQSNGSRAFVITTYIYEPGNYLTTEESVSPLSWVAKPNEFTLVMLEPLRTELSKSKYAAALPPRFLDLLFEADAAVILGGEKKSGAEELNAAK